MTDLAGLRKFLDESGKARGHSPFFVGRKPEIAFVEQVVSSEKGLRESRDTNGINLFSGPPGAGKTNLLQVVAERATEGKGPLAAPLVVYTTPETLTSLESLLALCAESALMLSQKHGNLGRFAEGAGKVLLNYLTLGKAEETLRHIRQVSLAMRPVVLLTVDEAQNSTEANKGVYTALNQGNFPIPAAAVFAGLSNTELALEKAGISRLGEDRHIRMPPLAAEDCREAMAKFLDRYEIGTERRESWLDLAETRSDFFPRHLHSVLLATARTAIGEKGGTLTEDSLRSAEVETAKDRSRFYKRRSSALSPAELWLAAKVVAEVEGREAGLPFVIGSILRQESHLENEEIRELAATLDHEKFAESLIRKGMLQKREDNTYEAPIPSFSTWLAQDYGRFLMHGHNSRNTPGG